MAAETTQSGDWRADTTRWLQERGFVADARSGEMQCGRVRVKLADHPAMHIDVWEPGTGSRWQARLVNPPPRVVSALLEQAGIGRMMP